MPSILLNKAKKYADASFNYLKLLCLNHRFSVFDKYILQRIKDTFKFDFWAHNNTWGSFSFSEFFGKSCLYSQENILLKNQMQRLNPLPPPASSKVKKCRKIPQKPKTYSL